MNESIKIVNFLANIVPDGKIIVRMKGLIR